MSGAFMYNSQLTPRATSRLCSSTSAATKRVAIIGGGLAGLAVAHFLIKKSDCTIDVYDKAPVGTGGASSVAGGLLHPYSPRGKLVHLGMESLQCTNKLVKEAQKYQPNCILKDAFYRVAFTQKNVEQLQSMALPLLSRNELVTAMHIDKTDLKGVLGGVCLSGGCKVLHVPSYLEGLWQSLSTRATWKIGPCSYLAYDTIVLAAGAGIFLDNVLDASKFPIQLLRGQSLEVTLEDFGLRDALLCGKYVIPLNNEKHKYLVGATHEFDPTAPFSAQEVQEVLQERFLNKVYDKDVHVTKITSGWRVQSQRGSNGRLPIAGKLDSWDQHPNAYILTGLSSRGLLYHGLYADILTDAMTNQVHVHDNLLNYWK